MHAKPVLFGSVIGAQTKYLPGASRLQPNPAESSARPGGKLAAHIAKHSDGVVAVVAASQTTVCWPVPRSRYVQLQQQVSGQVTVTGSHWQLLGLNCSVAPHWLETQLPLHNMVPASGHVHVRPVQICPPGQTLPQEPQLFISVSRLTHCLAQQV